MITEKDLEELGFTAIPDKRYINGTQWVWLLTRFVGVITSVIALKLSTN